MLIALFIAGCVDFLSPIIMEQTAYEAPKGATCTDRPIFFGLSSIHECIVSTAVSLDTPLVDVPTFMTPVSGHRFHRNPFYRLLLAAAVGLTVYGLLLPLCRAPLRADENPQ